MARLQLLQRRGFQSRITRRVGGIVGQETVQFAKQEQAEAPLLLGFILGPMMEENFRRALLLSRGDYTTFLTRPLSLSLLVLAAILVVIVALPSVKKKREETFVEED